MHQQISKSESTSSSEALHTIPDISLTGFGSMESMSYPGGNLTFGDSSSSPIDPGQDPSQAPSFWQSVQENQTALEARGFSE